MRRGFSTLLILLFGVGPLSAFVAGSEDANLPACCRRNGAHHCAMSARMMAAIARIPDSHPAFTAPLTCSSFPGLSLAILLPAHALTAEAESLRAMSFNLPARVAERSILLSTPGLAHAGRGPPISNPS